MTTDTFTADPTAVAETGSISLPAGTWRLDPVHSSASFAVKHMVVATFRGRFENFDATLSVGEDGRASLVGSVRADSIMVKDENLQTHLQSPEFFDTERYAEIGFASEAVRREGDELVADGTLTIKDRTLPVEVRGSLVGPAENIGGATTVGVTLETVIDRTAFGLEWNAPLPKGGVALANNVKLTVELELVREES